MKNASLAVLSATVGISVGAYAAEHTVGQKGRVFSVSEMIVRKGESVVFVNDDNVPHNVVSSSKDNEFNLGLQAPGMSTPVTFTAPGDVKILCAIHPRMQMTVKVTGE